MAKRRSTNSHKETESIPAHHATRLSSDRDRVAHMLEAVDVMSDGIAVYRSDGVLDFCNLSFRQIHGYRDEELVPGETSYDRLGDLDAENKTTKHTPLTFDQRIAQLRQDGDNVVRQYHGDRVFERRQSLTPSGGLINLHRDITAHHRLELVQNSRNDVLEKLARGASLSELLTALIEGSESVFTDMLGSVLLLDESGRRFTVGAAPSLPQTFVDACEGLEIDIGVGSCGTAVMDQATVIVSDIGSHPLWKEARELTLGCGLKACWSEPIIAVDGSALGTFAMYYREVREPSKVELRFIKESAKLAGVVIESYGHERALQSALSKAEQASRAKSEFLATMSHELRTPLNAILGFSDTLRGQYLGNIDAETYRMYADDIHRSGEHLLELINDVLDISEIEAGKRALRPESLDVVATLNECLKSVAPQAAANNVRVRPEFDDNVSVLFADQRSVKQIVLNLLSNAIKFSEQSGHVTLRATQIQNDLIIDVEDTGIGIPETRLRTITEPFTQGHTDPHLSQKGTGLGLSIVKSLIDAHQGSLSIKSDVGVGTCVSVRFPLKETL